MTELEAGVGTRDAASDLAIATRFTELKLVTGQTIPLTNEVVTQLEAELRSLRRSNTKRRNLVSEIRAYLTDHPGSSALEIARAIRARDHDIRSILRAGAPFQSVSPPAGRSGRLKAWKLAPTPAEAVPWDGTSGSAGDGEPR